MCRSEKVMAIEFSGDVRERKKERERKRENTRAKPPEGKRL